MKGTPGFSSKMEACLLCRLPIYGFYLRMDSNEDRWNESFERWCLRCIWSISRFSPGRESHTGCDALHTRGWSFIRPQASAAKVTEDILSNCSVCPSPHYHLCRPCVGPAPIPTQPHAPARSLTPPSPNTPQPKLIRNIILRKKTWRKKKIERGTFRHCGQRFPQLPDLIVEVDYEDYTRGIKGANMVTEQEITNLRSIADSGMRCTVLLSTLQSEGQGVMFDTGN